MNTSEPSFLSHPSEDCANFLSPLSKFGDPQIIRSGFYQTKNVEHKGQVFYLTFLPKNSSFLKVKNAMLVAWYTCSYAAFI